MAGAADDPEDLELDPPLPNEDEPEDLQDQALVDDEADDELEKDSPDDVAAQPQDRQPDQERQPSRGERRHQALANELRQRDERIAELNRRLDSVLVSQQPRQPQGESPEARANRLALLTPEERITAELHEAKQSFSQQLHMMEIRNADNSDRAAFQAKATVDPYYKKWESHVEAELQKLRQQGMNADREKVMFYLVGKAAIEGRKGPTATRQRAEAQRRVARQQTRPSNSGSDVQGSRRTGGNSLERRLENVEL